MVFVGETIRRCDAVACILKLSDGSTGRSLVNQFPIKTGHHFPFQYFIVILAKQLF